MSDKGQVRLEVFCMVRALSIMSSSLNVIRRIKKCTVTPFAALAMRSERTAPKMENQQLILPSRQCSSTPVGFSQGFLNKERCENTETSPILSWPGFSWYLPSRQCSSTPVGFSHGFLNKERCENTGTSPILSWPGFSWYLPVPSNEISIEGAAKD